MFYCMFYFICDRSLNGCWYLFQSVAEGDTVSLKAGNHRYPFKFTLPQNAPSSFECAYGSVRYTVEARIDQPSKSDHVTRSALTVISLVNLNLEPFELRVSTRIQRLTYFNVRRRSIFYLSRAGRAPCLPLLIPETLHSISYLAFV